jgi:hypothetical protein
MPAFGMAVGLDHGALAIFMRQSRRDGHEERHRFAIDLQLPTEKTVLAILAVAQLIPLPGVTYGAKATSCAAPRRLSVDPKWAW